jgi:hypothetical protein
MQPTTNDPNDPNSGDGYLWEASLSFIEQNIPDGSGGSYGWNYFFNNKTGKYDRIYCADGSNIFPLSNFFDLFVY